MKLTLITNSHTAHYFIELHLACPWPQVNQRNVPARGWSNSFLLFTEFFHLLNIPFAILRRKSIQRVWLFLLLCLNLLFCGFYLYALVAFSLNLKSYCRCCIVKPCSPFLIRSLVFWFCLTPVICSLQTENYEVLSLAIVTMKLATTWNGLVCNIPEKCPNLRIKILNGVPSFSRPFPIAEYNGTLKALLLLGTNRLNRANSGLDIHISPHGLARMTNHKRFGSSIIEIILQRFVRKTISSNRMHRGNVVNN